VAVARLSQGTKRGSQEVSTHCLKSTCLLGGGKIGNGEKKKKSERYEKREISTKLTTSKSQVE